MEKDLNTELGEEQFHPSCFGYELHHIEIGEETYLETAYEGETVNYSFPIAKEMDKTILHGPDELWFFEGTQLYLGILSKFHGDSDVKYIWAKNDTEIVNGVGKNIIPISEAGLYSCLVKKDDTVGQSSYIQVVESVRDTEIQEDEGDTIPKLQEESKPNESLEQELDNEFLSVDKN